jgi:hypothetical protein
MLKKYGCLDEATWADAKNTACHMRALLSFATLFGVFSLLGDAENRDGLDWAPGRVFMKRCQDS